MMLNFLWKKMDLSRQSASGILSRLQYSLRKTIYTEWHSSHWPLCLFNLLWDILDGGNPIYFEIHVQSCDDGDGHFMIGPRVTGPFWEEVSHDLKLLPWDFLPHQNDPSLLPCRWSLVVENTLPVTVYVRSWHMVHFSIPWCQICFCTRFLVLFFFFYFIRIMHTYFWNLWKFSKCRNLKGYYKEPSLFCTYF